MGHSNQILMIVARFEVEVERLPLQPPLLQTCRIQAAYPKTFPLTLPFLIHYFALLQFSILGVLISKVPI